MLSLNGRSCIWYWKSNLFAMLSRRFSPLHLASHHPVGIGLATRCQTHTHASNKSWHSRIDRRSNIASRSTWYDHWRIVIELSSACFDHSISWWTMWNYRRINHVSLSWSVFGSIDMCGISCFTLCQSHARYGSSSLRLIIFNYLWSYAQLFV